MTAPGTWVGLEFGLGGRLRFAMDFDFRFESDVLDWQVARQVIGFALTSLRMNSLTMRSSSEWKLITTRRPPTSGSPGRLRGRLPDHPVRY
jgi:hypothetical protein